MFSMSQLANRFKSLVGNDGYFIACRCRQSIARFFTCSAAHERKVVNSSCILRNRLQAGFEQCTSCFGLFEKFTISEEYSFSGVYRATGMKCGLTKCWHCSSAQIVIRFVYPDFYKNETSFTVESCLIV